MVICGKCIGNTKYIYIMKVKYKKSLNVLYYRNSITGSDINNASLVCFPKSLHIYIYIYIYMCVCVCVCVCNYICV